jgi:hypothetical protein
MWDPFQPAAPMSSDLHSQSASDIHAFPDRDNIVSNSIMFSEGGSPSVEPAKGLILVTLFCRVGLQQSRHHAGTQLWIGVVAFRQWSQP